MGKGYSALRDGYCAVTYLQGIPSFGWLSGWGAPTSPGLLSFVYFSFTALPLIDLSAYDPSLTTTRLPSLARKEKQRSRPRDPHLESASALKRSTISPPSRSSTASTTIKRPPRATTAKKLPDELIKRSTRARRSIKKDRDPEESSGRSVGEKTHSSGKKGFYSSRRKIGQIRARVSIVFFCHSLLVSPPPGDSCFPSVSQPARATLLPSLTFSFFFCLFYLFF